MHLAYVSADRRDSTPPHAAGRTPDYAPVLAGFEAIDEGRRVLEDRAALARGRTGGRRPHLDRQHPAARARTARPGAAPLRPPLVCVRPPRLARRRQRASRCTGCVRSSRTSPRSTCPRSPGVCLPRHVRSSWPRITRYDDRWRWITTSVVPHFRRFDADMRRVDASLLRIFDDARGYAATPCALPPASTRPRTQRPPTAHGNPSTRPLRAASHRNQVEGRPSRSASWEPEVRRTALSTRASGRYASATDADTGIWEDALAAETQAAIPRLAA